MIIIIPLGGLGKRFKDNNYEEPKALIKVFGKPILFWLLDSLTIDSETIIYIPYNNEYKKFRLEDLLRKTYPNINFIFLELYKNTNGAAETLNIALNKLELDDQSIISLDSDNFYNIDILSKWNNDNTIFTFTNNNLNDNRYSYIKINNHNLITDIQEKICISDKACTGAYGFKSYKILLKYTEQILKTDNNYNGEYYISNIINQMLIEDNIFYNINIHNNDYTCLGTPLQLKQFYNNFPLYSCINSKNKLKKMRICFDLDNTLVTFPKITNDYTTVQPIHKNINYLKYLKSFNHTIIIYTARKMKTYDGNIGKIMSNIGKITFDTLDKFEIPYDEIYFGKPYADVYIDDLAINCFDDIEKKLGFYQETITTRSFNKIENQYIEIYTKKSSDLSGEIYYYNNIPHNIKDMFPLFIDYDKINYKYYSIEKIDGLSVSNMYTSQLLTIETFQHILNSIQRIHNSEINITDDNVNIYSNYIEKIKYRYKNFDYSKFVNSNLIYQELITNLQIYEDNNSGNKVIIHGDSVFTNILINNYDKIKFIDMRGKLHNKLSIYGDFMYDFAKIYQSLIGYDKILLNKSIDFEYEKKFIIYFKNYFINKYSIEDFNNLKLITKSLIFSLIPLHNNSSYISNLYQLLNSEYIN